MCSYVEQELYHLGLQHPTCILELDSDGVFRQVLTKIHCKHWAKDIHDDQMGEYFKDELVHHLETLEHTIDETQFSINCTRDNKFVSKNISTHVLSKMIEMYGIMQRVVTDG